MINRKIIAGKLLCDIKYVKKLTSFCIRFPTVIKYESDMETMWFYVILRAFCIVHMKTCGCFTVYTFRGRGSSILYRRFEQLNILYF